MRADKAVRDEWRRTRGAVSNPYLTCVRKPSDVRVIALPKAKMWSLSIIFIEVLSDAVYQQYVGGQKKIASQI